MNSLLSEIATISVFCLQINQINLKCIFMVTIAFLELAEAAASKQQN
jgi:hypothetical protein